MHEKALRMAGALRSEVRPSDAVAILAGDPGAIAPAVQAVWLLGGSVTMLQQPTPRTDLAHWSDETLRALGVIGAELVLLGAPFEELAEVFADSRFPCRSLSELVDTASEPLGDEVVGNLTFAQALELAKMKSDAMMAKGLKTAVKEVLGTCVSMGVTIDGKDAREVQQEIDEGKHDEELR